MPFQPNPSDALSIDHLIYRIAEHPAAPGMPHGQEGRAGTVYHLLPEGGGEESALKVFKPRFRLPSLVSQSERIAGFANLPGLKACRRRVITPSRNGELLRQHPDLTYAVLMPWIEGPTWLEVLVEKQTLPPQQSLELARAMAGVLMNLEERGLAHCDLSAPNVMLPLLAGGQGVELIDLEGMYAPGLLQPQEVSSGSAGYAHPQVAGGLWGMEADRFAGAVLLAEMLGWCDPAVVQAAWGESYFEPGEMQREGLRYHTLLASLRRHWGEGAAALFERAWKSETLADCPTFGEWLVAFPQTAPLVTEQSSQVISPPSERDEAVLSPSTTELARAQTQALMQVGRQLEEMGDLQGALVNYRQAHSTALRDAALGALAQEIAWVVQNLENRQQGQQRASLLTYPSQVPFYHPPHSQIEEKEIERQPVPSQPKAGWGTWFGWLLAGAIAAGIVVISLGFFDESTLSLLLGGIALGIGQWLVLRRHLQRVGWWIAATALGVGGAGFIVYVVGEAMIWFALAFGGALAGFLQWLVIRSRLRRAGWWILANAIGWVGFVVAFIPLTGAVLVWLLNQPRPEDGV